MCGDETSWYPRQSTILRVSPGIMEMSCPLFLSPSQVQSISTRRTGCRSSRDDTRRQPPPGPGGDEGGRSRYLCALLLVPTVTTSRAGTGTSFGQVFSYDIGTDYKRHSYRATASSTARLMPSKASETQQGPIRPTDRASSAGPTQVVGLAQPGLSLIAPRELAVKTGRCESKLAKSIPIRATFIRHLEHDNHFS